MVWENPGAGAAGGACEAWWKCWPVVIGLTTVSDALLPSSPYALRRFIDLDIALPPTLTPISCLRRIFLYLLDAFLRYKPFCRL